MKCESVHSSLSLYADSCLPEGQRRAVTAHLTACADCAGRWDDLRHVQASLRGLPRAASPKTLASRLRVMASHEQARRQGAGEFSSPWAKCRTRAKIWARDLMRPLAVPAAGGLLSSVLFFTMLVDTFAFQMPAQSESDIPLGVYTQATVDTLSPFGFSGHDMTIELTIDKSGHVTNFSVPTGSASRDVLKQLGNLILFTSFNPAMAYGQPTAGKVVVKSVRINVRG
jgi:hypothetical protein